MEAMQHTRRATPYPLTWEIPVVALLATLLALIVGIQCGRSLANLVAGDGWVFVDRAALFSTLGGVLDGQAGAGLSDLASPASAALLWTCIALVELLVIVLIGLVLKAGLDRWGPARLRGMATAVEAEALLGRSRLRKHAKVIRPDLHGAPRGAWR